MTIMYILFQPKYTKYMYTYIYGTYNDYLISHKKYLNETEIPYFCSLCYAKLAILRHFKYSVDIKQGN